MQTRSQKGPLLYTPDLERTIVRPNRRRARPAVLPDEGNTTDQDFEQLLADEIEEIVIMAADDRRTLADYAMPGEVKVNPAIVLPAINAPTFELKPGLIQMMQHASIFHGFQSENPHTHVHTFLEICGTTRIQGVSEDAIKLKLFPFSLRGEAKEWYNSLPAESITTWAELEKEFLSQYFPPSKTAQCLSEIFTFCQKENESFFDCWKRFKALLRKCPHHGLDLQRQVNTFFSGLTELTKGMVNSSSGGAFLKKTPEEGWALFEDIAKYNYAPSYQAIQAPLPPPRIEEVNSQNEIAMLKQQMAALTTSLNQKNQNPSFPQNSQVLYCDNCCQTGHMVGQCQFISPSTYQVNAVQNHGQYNPVTCQTCDNVGHTSRFCPMNGQNAEVNAFYDQQNQRFNNQFSGQSNYQNQGFNQNQNFNRNPSFNQNQNTNFFNQNQRFNQNWPNNSNSAFQNRSSQPYPQNYQNSQGPSHSSDIKAQWDSFREEQNRSMKNLERQIGQLAGQLASRPPGQLPSFTEKNPKDGQVAQTDLNHSQCTDLVPSIPYGREEASAMNLRSGTQLSIPPNQENH